MRQSVYQSIFILLDGRGTGERGLAWARQDLLDLLAELAGGSS